MRSDRLHNMTQPAGTRWKVARRGFLWLAQLTTDQKKRLGVLEGKTPDSKSKQMFKALLLLVKRAEQIQARRLSPGRSKPVLAIKEILNMTEFSSRDTLCQLVKRYDPNNPAAVAMRKNRVPGATPAIIEELQKACTHGDVKDYEQGSAWLRTRGLKVSPATYYRWLKPVTLRQQKAAKVHADHAQLALRILAKAAPNKPAASKGHSVKPTRPDRKSKERAIIEKAIEDLKSYQEEQRAKLASLLSDELEGKLPSTLKRWEPV